MRSPEPVAAYLETDPLWSQSPQTILAYMDIGPELLYRTHHKVVGTPYHRNGDGIYDGHRMLATGDPETARALVEERGIDLVLLCRTPSERAFYADRDGNGNGNGNLYQQLDRGLAPDWLQAVELPPALAGDALLYRVLR